MRMTRSHERNIPLVGLPGAGKSTVGQALARRLGRRFVDSDREVDRRSGLSICQIFDRLGEGRFRELEAQVVGELVLGRGKVIAFGGGTFSSEAVRVLVQHHCISVWLDPPFEVLLERVRSSSSRPLFAAANCEDTLRELASSRRPTLEEARLRISDACCATAVEAITRALARLTGAAA